MLLPWFGDEDTEPVRNTFSQSLHVAARGDAETEVEIRFCHLLDEELPVGLAGVLSG